MKLKDLPPKDRNAIKGALRRAFARSQLHHEVIAASVVSHSDPERPRVKTWAKCNVCKKPEAKSYMVVDHIQPLVPVDTAFEDMSLDNVLDRLWCVISGLQVICPSCHDSKTKIERIARKANKQKGKGK